MVEVRNFIKGKAQKVVSTTESAYRKVEGYVDNKIQERERNSLDRDLRNEKNNLIDRVSGVLDDYRKEISRYRLQLKSTQAQENPNIKMGVYKTIEGRTKDLPSHLTQAVNKCGYSNMKAFKQYLISNGDKITKENIAQYLNNMKNPPFPYYYNTKKVRAICKTGIIKGDAIKYFDSIMETLKTDNNWCNNPLSDNMIKLMLINKAPAAKKREEALKNDKQDEKIITISGKTINEIYNMKEEFRKLIIKRLQQEEIKDNESFDNFLAYLKRLLENCPDLYNKLEKTLTVYRYDNDTQNLPWNDTNNQKGKRTGLIEIINTIFNSGATNISISKEKLKEKKQKNNKAESHNTEEEYNTEEEHNTEEELYEDIFEEIENIEYPGLSLLELKNKILNIFMDNGIDLKDDDIKSDIYARYGSMIESLPENILNKNHYIVLTYALTCGIDDINNETDLKDFIKTVKAYGQSGSKYDEQYKRFLAEMGQYYEECIREIAIQSLIERYYAANAVAETRGFYESDFINFIATTTDGQTQSGLQVASNIDDIDNKLNHYGFNYNKSEHDEAALRYTAFDITFKNTFTLSNPIIEKLAAQQIDLRDDLFNYRIYNQDDNYFDKKARDKYVAEKLQPIGLTPEEIDELLNSMEQLPREVEKNYEILSDNFDADQNSFEKIAKIYALGEVIDNIKKLFTNNETLSDNQKLSDLMGLKLDESEPADVVGDYLLLNGTINGTKTKIKYNLRTGKLYMNALTQQEFNPPKITIGNDEPNTEIGDIGNFDDLLEGYQPTSFSQSDDVDDNQLSSTMDNNPYNQDSSQLGNKDSNQLDNRDSNESDNETQNQKILEKLVENKLVEKLQIIGKVVQEKAGEQSKENVVIDDFLKTFNILPDDGNSGTIEFLGGSSLFVMLESIKNTNDEDYLLKFSSLMSELMSFCGLTRGKNNLLPQEPEFNSVTIFNIDEKNATQDIISLQRANKNFFSEENGEKYKIKNCESHFDSSVQLSFANIIAQKCCRRYGDGRKISAKLAEDFVNSVKEGIENIKKDENDLVAMENIIDDDSMWA